MTEASRKDAIVADALSFAYPGGIQALTDVTFRAARGEFLALVGPNGSGKTTLMKLLLGLQRPQRGRVLLDGQDILQLKPAQLYRRVGMVFQNPADQLFAATVEQDVAFGPRNLGLAETQVTQRVNDALAAVDVLPLRDRPIHHLSFGEQKRVCLAGVLAMQPSVLVLDEPTAGLDPAGEAHMIELLLRLNRQHDITIILSTHAVDLLPILTHRIYVLCHGRVLREGTAQQVLSHHQTIVQAGLRLPIIAQLFQDLACCEGLSVEPLPMTIQEARQRILDWLPAGAGCAAAGRGAP